jgi:alkanesulfonate monooxygenase SsuD/methylene tetrahydromethanopterin reductase-like flavin-dependent oxidoreductase (luciferase family)
MEIGLNVRHQNGAPWEAIRDEVLAAERLGFDAVHFPDHYLPTEHVTNADGGAGIAADSSVAGPTDNWTLIATLVPMTSTIRFGTRMTSSTFRFPGPLAITVGQLNRIGRGRLDLGLGTNWHEPEHLAFGIPFAPQGERFSRLEDQLAIIRGFWSTPADGHFNHDGPFFTVKDGPGIPHPPEGPPRLVVGGSGLKRTPRLAATFADEANSLSRTPEQAVPFFSACDAACEKRGRDPKSLRRSVLLSSVTCGEDDADIDRQLALAGITREQTAGRGLLCGPAELVERLQEWDASGVDQVVISRRGAVDPISLQLIGERVLPPLGKIAAPGEGR